MFIKDDMLGKYIAYFSQKCIRRVILKVSNAISKVFSVISKVFDFISEVYLKQL